ncbi:MAG: DUF4435 domain-containing protein [Oscillospiraceae bacterium]|nr:DUF4435 domain-containing protein [Oscillospiraceae bacterium]
MITKESLIAERESVNEAVLKIKQKYSKSPTEKTIFIIVEGKDDITFYGMKAENYKHQDLRIQVIAAGNRKKVVDVYRKLDWNTFSKSRVLFIVDRDLSDYTKEDTPTDDNIYVTDNYSIENDVCTPNTYIKVLKYLAQLNDIDDVDETELLTFYNHSEQQFFNIATPIMALILYWKLNGIDANYANVNFGRIFQFEDNNLSLHPTFKKYSDVIKFVCDKSKVTYDASIDLSCYEELLQNGYQPIHYIRGKYLSCFFSSIINYTVEKSKDILTSKKSSKLSLTVGNKDLIVKLSGYMNIPISLHNFLSKLKLAS